MKGQKRTPTVAASLLCVPPNMRGSGGAEGRKAEAGVSGPPGHGSALDIGKSAPVLGAFYGRKFLVPDLPQKNRQAKP